MDAAIEHDVFFPSKRSDDARAADFRARAERMSSRVPRVLLVAVVVLLVVVVLQLLLLHRFEIVNSLFSGEVLERHVSLSLSLFVCVSYKITRRERTKERERERARVKTDVVHLVLYRFVFFSRSLSRALFKVMNSSENSSYSFPRFRVIDGVTRVIRCE